MATQVSQSNNCRETELDGGQPIDVRFDLDDAFTMSGVSAVRNEESEEESTRCSVRVAEMPTVMKTELVDACTVCMEAFEDEEGGKQIPCGHVFHPPCISAWLSLSSSCPLCRSCIF